MPTTFSEALGPLAKRIQRPVRDIEILRIVAQLNGDNFLTAADIARKAVLAWAKRRAGGDLPKEAWDHLDFEILAGGRNSAAVRLQTETADLWALRAEDPDKNVAGRIWTTEVVIGGEAGKRPQLSLRLIVSTTELEFSVEPHVPGSVLQIVSSPGLLREGQELRDTPSVLETGDDAEVLCDELEHSERRLPIFVVTLPDGESAKPLIDAIELARATTGIARVVQLPAELTWVLTKRFGKQRSVFDGAVRAYLPGFSNSDDPYRHRLFLATSLQDAANARTCSVSLRLLAANYSILTTRLGKDVVDFAAVRTASRRLRANDLAEKNAPDAELLAIAKELNESLEKEVTNKDNEIEYYTKEVDAAEERAKAAEQENRSLLFKIRQLQDALERGGSAHATESLTPKNWPEFTDWLDQTFPDRVVLTPAARRMVRSPEFEDVGLVARAITWLATVQHFRRIKGGGSTRDETIESGIVNAYCGGDTYQTFWQGRRYDVDQHVKNGGNVRDPRRCLRIYYFWEPDLQQTIVDHIPSHRTTSAS